MDRVRNTSKHLPEAFLTLCEVKVIQSHEVKRVKFKIVCFGGVIHDFRRDFRQ